ncbi:MAG: glucan 1,4-alpha-glucosidase, partial [Proteobacteria bacterium]
LTPSAEAKASQKVDVELKLEWLVCQEECVPGFATLKIARPVVGAAAKWKTQAKSTLDFFASRVPKPGAESSYKIISAKVEGETLAVTVTGFSAAAKTSATSQPPALEIFPLNGEAFGPANPQFAKSSEDEGTFLIPIVPAATLPETSGFVLKSAEPKAGEPSWEFDNVKITKAAAPLAASQTESSSLPLIIFFSFIGGVILNLMPCVFPVLSIKVFSIMKGDTSPAARKRDGWLYTAGVLVTFAALGAGFLVLRSAGNAVGWGFQLQSPLVVLALAILFWLMALNFLGAFEFGTSVMNVAGKRNSNSSFATGVLSVFVAAPCTGPFMGSALGAAATLPAASAMLIFLMLGLGLAFPFLLIALVPAVAK